MAGKQRRRGQGRRKGEQRIGTCVYCSRTGPVTRDHVFAKSLYREPPANPVIVDACNRCNQTKSLGDRDLRAFVNMDVYGAQHPDAWGHITEMAEKRPAFKYWLGKAVRESERLELVSPAGLHVGNLTALPFNAEYVIECQTMVVRALHYVETGRILARTHDVHAVHLAWNVGIPLLQTIANAVEINLNTPGHRVAGWQSFEMEDHPGEDRFWLIVYNEGVLFIGGTGQLAESLQVGLSKERLALLPRKVLPWQMQVPTDVEGRPIVPPQE